jgi:hypothetical protein
VIDRVVAKVWQGACSFSPVEARHATTPDDPGYRNGSGRMRDSADLEEAILRFQVDGAVQAAV